MKFTQYTRWDLLPASINALFKQCERASLFYSRAWLENMTHYTLDEGQSLLLACVIDNDDVLALLPLILTNQNHLKPISNTLTTHFSLLLGKDTPQKDVLARLAEGLSQLPAKSIRLEPIDSRDNHIQKLQKLMEQHHFQVHRHFRFYNWIHRLNGQSFNEYINERPGQLRSTIRRKPRKLEREHGYEIRLYTDENIPRAQADYDAVYLKSWKASEALSDFTPELVKTFSGLGWLRLAVLYVKQQPVAAQIWFVVAQKASIYRLVYDPDWKSYSPGSILTHYLMQHVIETDRVNEIDFLNGNEAYKQDWMTLRNERWSLTFIKPVQPRNWLQKMVQSVMERKNTWREFRNRKDRRTT